MTFCHSEAEFASMGMSQRQHETGAAEARGKPNASAPFDMGQHNNAPLSHMRGTSSGCFCVTSPLAQQYDNLTRRGGLSFPIN